MADSLVRQVTYKHDHFLNLSQQEKNFPVGQATETFGYDELQRLTGATRRWTGAGLPSTVETVGYGYDDLGNIRSKSDYGTPYRYGTRPHAVTSVANGGELTYDANGNMVSGMGRTLTFDVLDKPVTVVMGGVTTTFAYAPDGSRYRQFTTGPSGFGPKTVYYVDKDYELVAKHDTGETEERAYVGASVVVRRSSFTGREVRYQHLDRLGSLDAVTSSALKWTGGSASGGGQMLETAPELLVDAHGYDPFGKPRARAWTASGDRLHPGGEAGITTAQGFTGHEHLDNVYLIHMNGRVYDYRLGRFLSVDPIISEPANSQSINPYSYIGNNPLSGVDPTGYMAVSTGCGSYASCNVIMVNPSPATLRLCSCP